MMDGLRPEDLAGLAATAFSCPPQATLPSSCTDYRKMTLVDILDEAISIFEDDFSDVVTHLSPPSPTGRRERDFTARQ